VDPWRRHSSGVAHLACYLRKSLQVTEGHLLSVFKGPTLYKSKIIKCVREMASGCGLVGAPAAQRRKNRPLIDTQCPILRRFSAKSMKRTRLNTRQFVSHCQTLDEEILFKYTCSVLFQDAGMKR